jgi:hypothetical protein
LIFNFAADFSAPSSLVFFGAGLGSAFVDLVGLVSTFLVFFAGESAAAVAAAAANLSVSGTAIELEKISRKTEKS